MPLDFVFNGCPLIITPNPILIDVNALSIPFNIHDGSLASNEIKKTLFRLTSLAINLRW